MRGNAQAAPPAPNFLEQMENVVTTIVRDAQKSVVSIEVRAPAANLAIPRLPVPPDREKEREKEKDRRPLEGEEDEIAAKIAQEAIRGQVNDMAQALGLTRTGSGFLLQGGFVVTTYEVVAQSKELPQIILNDGKRVRANWVNAHKNANIAVLKVEVPENLGLEWGDSDKVTAGNFALTIGNQAGFMNSASLGLVAGINRSGFSGGIRYDNLIQFQGAVGVGGSGSPLLNSRGEVVGMVIAAPAGAMMQRAERVNNANAVRVAALNVAGQPAAEPEPQAQIFQQERGQGGVFFFGGLANTGFALPSNWINPLVKILRQGPGAQPTKTGWMGVYIADPNGPDNGKGVLLTRIYIGRPADRAGLRAGDLITSINGKPVRTKNEMRDALQTVLSGQAIRLEVKRGKMTLTRTLITEPKPDQEEMDTLPYHELP